MQDVNPFVLVVVDPSCDTTVIGQTLRVLTDLRIPLRTIHGTASTVDFDEVPSGDRPAVVIFGTHYSYTDETTPSPPGRHSYVQGHHRAGPGPDGSSQPRHRDVGIRPRSGNQCRIIRRTNPGHLGCGLGEATHRLPTVTIS